MVPDVTLLSLHERVCVVVCVLPSGLMYDLPYPHYHYLPPGLRQYYASMSPWLLQSRGCCHRSQSFSRGLKEEDLPPGSSPLPPGLAHFCTFSRGRDWSRDSLGSYPTLGLRQGHGQGPGMGLCPRTGLDTLSLADPQVFRPTSGGSLSFPG